MDTEYRQFVMNDKQIWWSVWIWVLWFSIIKEV